MPPHPGGVGVAMLTTTGRHATVTSYTGDALARERRLLGFTARTCHVAAARDRSIPWPGSWCPGWKAKAPPLHPPPGRGNAARRGASSGRAGADGIDQIVRAAVSLSIHWLSTTRAAHDIERCAVHPLPESAGVSPSPASSLDRHMCAPRQVFWRPTGKPVYSFVSIDRHRTARAREPYWLSVLPSIALQSPMFSSDPAARARPRGFVIYSNYTH